MRSMQKVSTILCKVSFRTASSVKKVTSVPSVAIFVLTIRKQLLLTWQKQATA